TKTIVHRILNIVEHGTSPSNILAVTFTNKAAREMRERVRVALEERSSTPLSYGDMPVLATFHSLGATILRSHAEALGFSKHLSIIDPDDGLSIIKNILKDLGYDPKDHDPRGIREKMSRAKNECRTIEEFTSSARTPMEKLAAQVWGFYQVDLKKQNSVDFDDLLLLPLVLFDKRPDILEHYQNTFKYIHIDEYQDTNEVQYRFANLLAAKHHNLCIVGDADQTIYTWRGAQIENILRFEVDYPKATVVLLEENYRSTQTILEAANQIIKKNENRKEKNLFTRLEKGEKITTFEGYDERHEGSFIAEKAMDAIVSGVPGKEIAVLYRTNFQSRILEEAMLARNVPYTVLGVRFFERKEVRDLLAYLRAALNPKSQEDVKRSINIPARGIGKVTLTKLFLGGDSNGNLFGSGAALDIPPKTMAKINEYFGILSSIRAFAENNIPSEIIKFALTKSGIEKMLKEGSADDVERLMNLEELVTLAVKYDHLSTEEGIEQFLAEAALASDADESDRDKAEGVRLMTIHAAKGLEFDTVFISGLEDGLFPLRRDGQRLRNEEAEEERRLMYVAVTRAKKKLYMSHSMFRTIYGSKEVRSPSEYMYDIPEELLEKTNGGGGSEPAYREKTIYFDL
ncbi:MAG TPA: 3'-5' exonuclease, partial [Candidatus Paceibacterota bacterium]|nr:3'-5' exonuclease [Candidatus Paceibacterota bacterium]